MVRRTLAPLCSLRGHTPETPTIQTAALASTIAALGAVALLLPLVEGGSTRTGALDPARLPAAVHGEPLDGLGPIVRVDEGGEAWLDGERLAPDALGSRLADLRTAQERVSLVPGVLFVEADGSVDAAVVQRVVADGGRAGWPQARLLVRTPR